MQAIYLAGGMPFRDEIIQCFAVNVNAHNEETGEDELIYAIGTLKVDGAVTLFRSIESADTSIDLDRERQDIIFSIDADKIIDLTGWELFSVQTIDEFNSRRMEEERGYKETDIDDNY